MTQPTVYEQYMLELVNRARLDPDEEVNRFNETIDAYNAVYSNPRTEMTSVTDGGANVTSTPKQPLAFNELLTNAAKDHTNWMLEADVFSHKQEDSSGSGTSTTPGLGLTFGDRYDAVGYDYSSGAENISRSSTGGIDLTQHVLWRHESLFYSVGHRENILNDTYGFRELGIGIERGDYKGSNNIMVTQNFGRSGSTLYLTGVAFDDLTTDDDFYTVGEGLRGILVTAKRQSDNKSFSTTTMDAGGYNLALTAGTYDVSFSLGGVQLGTTQAVTIGSENVKLDLNTDTIVTPADFNNAASVVGTNNAEDIIGDDNNQTLDGLDGNDRIYGVDGDDLVVGGNGDDLVVGGKNNDRLVAWNGNDILIGVDPIKPDPGKGEVDWLTGHGGMDTFVLGDGNGAYYNQGSTWAAGWQDRAIISDFNSVEDKILLHGNSSNYQLNINNGSTMIFYGESGSGFNELIGIVNGVTGLDLTDATQFNYADHSFSIKGTASNELFFGSEVNQTIDGFDGNDKIYGLDGDDLVIGGSGDDLVIGGNGNDTLSGGQNNDRLVAWNGDDTLIGVDPTKPNPGKGELDWLSGHGGADTFVLGDSNGVYYNQGGTVAESWQDRGVISDFNLSEDKIQLYGSSSNYQLNINNGSTTIFYGESGTGFNELVGVVIGVTGLDLTDATQFNYV